LEANIFPDEWRQMGTAPMAVHFVANHKPPSCARKAGRKKW